MVGTSLRLDGCSQWLVMGMGQALGVDGSTTSSDSSVLGSRVGTEVGTEVARRGFLASLGVAFQCGRLVKVSGPQDTQEKCSQVPAPPSIKCKIKRWKENGVVDKKKFELK